jgi:arsenate reductase (thioredoxin)
VHPQQRAQPDGGSVRQRDLRRPAARVQRRPAARHAQPVVVEAMREIGYDIERNSTKGVDDVEIRSRDYDFVITVCDEASAEACPIYPTRGERLHWSFADPSSFGGSREEILTRTREVRDAIAARVQTWCAELPPG